MRAIAFTRVSTAKQDEGVRQIQQIKKYCTEKNYELLEDKTISEIVSGVANERVGLTELMELTKADADIIIVSEASRLTRKSNDDFMDLYSIVKTIQSTGLDLYILGSSQTYTADKKLTLIDVITLVIEADRNAKEREQSKVRFATGKEKKLSAGGFIGHLFPYGYFHNGQKKDYFAINEEEAFIVRLLFDLVGTQGYSVNQTAMHVHRVYNCMWDTRSILRMLNNKTYTGEFTIMGKVLTVPAIVTAEQWELAQTKISSNHLFINKGNKHFNALKGIAKCACGCSLYITNTGSNNKEKKTYFTYKCASKSSSYTLREGCKNHGIDTKFLNNIVWNITKQFINIDDFKVKTEQQKKIINLEVKAIEKRVLTLLADKSELTVKIDSLTDTIIDADKSIIPTLSKRLSELVVRSAGVEKEIEKINIESTRMKDKLKDLSITILPTLVNEVSEEEKHEIFLKYIDKVSYFSVNLYKGFVLINFKNGINSVIITSNRPKAAYHLPYLFSFNPETNFVSDGRRYSADVAGNFCEFFINGGIIPFKMVEAEYNKIDPQQQYKLNI